MVKGGALAEVVKQSEAKAEEGDVDASMAAAAKAERLKEEHDQNLVTMTVRRRTPRSSNCPHD